MTKEGGIEFGIDKTSIKTPSKQDESLLLTPAEIEEAYYKACRECEVKSPRKYAKCFVGDCFETKKSIAKAQLTKDRPLIEKQYWEKVKEALTEQRRYFEDSKVGG